MTILCQIAETMTPRRSKAYESFLDDAESVRDVLAGPDPTPLELLLAEQAAIGFLDVRRCEGQRDAATNQGLPMKTIEHFDRRASRAHARWMRTLRTLGQVRKLDLSLVQIVNVGGPPR